MPLSVLEAMAVGLPMITVQEKGLAELIKDGVNGFFVPSDQPQALAEKILELIGQSKTLEKFSIASRELANKYSKENVTCLLEKAYEQALKFKKEK
jgi:glycosyltransferase involved in cell wall biosynthesis